MKLKEFGPRGGASLGSPLDSPMNCKGPFVVIFYLWWSTSFTSWTQRGSDNRNESLILAYVQKGLRTNGRNPDVLDWSTWRKVLHRYIWRRRNTERLLDVLLTSLPVRHIGRSNRTPRIQFLSCLYTFRNNWCSPRLGKLGSTTGSSYTVYILYPNLEPPLETIAFFLKIEVRLMPDKVVLLLLTWVHSNFHNVCRL